MDIIVELIASTLVGIVGWKFIWRGIFEKTAKPAIQKAAISALIGSGALGAAGKVIKEGAKVLDKPYAQPPEGHNLSGIKAGLNGISESLSSSNIGRVVRTAVGAGMVAAAPVVAGAEIAGAGIKKIDEKTGASKKISGVVKTIGHKARFTATSVAGKAVYELTHNRLADRIKEEKMILANDWNNTKNELASLIPDETKRKIKSAVTLGKEKANDFALQAKDGLETAALYALEAKDFIHASQGYKLGKRGLITIAGAVTGGAFLTHKFSAPKGTKDEATLKRASIEAARIPDNYIVAESAPNINVRLQDNRFNITKEGHKLFTQNIKQTVKMERLKKASRESNGYNFNSEQSVRYLNLKRMQEQRNAQGENKSDLQDYFEPAIKQDPQLRLSTQEMFKAIEKAKNKETQSQSDLNQLARIKTSDEGSSDKAVKDMLQEIFNESDDVKSKFYQLINENYGEDINNLSAERLQEIEEQARENGETIEDLKMREIESNTEDVVKHVMEQIIKAPESDEAREYLGEEGQKKLIEALEKDKDEKEKKYNEFIKKYENNLDQKFVQDHPEYKDKKSYEIRDARRKEDMKGYLNEAMKEIEYEKDKTSSSTDETYFGPRLVLDNTRYTNDSTVVRGNFNTTFTRSRKTRKDDAV